MISMNNLGSNGRLGNQMFQYASLKGIARNNGHDFCIPYSMEIDPFFDHMLSATFEMSSVNFGHGNFDGRNENDFTFDNDLFENCPDNIDLSGYFQSPKYFNHIKEEILKDFTFREKYDAENIYDVTIHVRRTDYVPKTEYHGLCSEEYYVEAMENFPVDSTFLVVSDDIEWCKQQKIFEGCDFSSDNNYKKDLYLMTKSKNNIIANSSFSWWGAWLNQNPDKIVIAPKFWFNPNYMPIEKTQDLVPNEWIRL